MQVHRKKETPVRKKKIIWSKKSFNQKIVKRNSFKKMDTNQSIQNSTETVKKSVSRSEVGHIKNISHFQSLTSFCVSYGAAYNPVKESLKIENQITLYNLVQEKINALKNKKIAFDIATDDRRNAFANFKSFTTRLVNSFAVSGVDELTLENAKSINKKIQGSTSKKSSENADKSISTSQQSYDRHIDHFTGLIELFQQHPSFAPNEDDLKIDALQAKLQDLKSKNTAVINTYTEYSNAMIDRDEILYNPSTGMVQIAKEIKQYIKSVFGAGSPQYKQVSGLKIQNYSTR